MGQNNKAIILQTEWAKYILAKARNEQQEEYLIVASMPLSYHKDIARNLQDKLSLRKESLECILGGGYLGIDRDAKTIRTNGSSGSYGYAPLDKVESVLKENFPDYKLDIQ